MTNSQYLIIGGGMRVEPTVDGIRQVDCPSASGWSARSWMLRTIPPTYRKIACEMCRWGMCRSRWRLPAN